MLCKVTPWYACTPILHFMQNKLDVLSRLKNWFEKSCLGDRQAPELVWNITDWKFETVMNMNPGFQINMQDCIRDHFCKANCKQSKLEVEGSHSPSLCRVHYNHPGRCESLQWACPEERAGCGWCEAGHPEQNGPLFHCTASKRCKSIFVDD